MFLRRSVLILAATIASHSAAAQGAGRYVETEYPPGQRDEPLRFRDEELVKFIQETRPSRGW